MKCPFLVIRKDTLDKDGNKTGEELEIQDCIKNDCMIFDGATKLCSLLASNMKTGVLIDDVKQGMKEVKEEIYQRSEAMSVTLATTVQTLQDAILGRFDLFQKQNEVIALGFDKIGETIGSKFEGLNAHVSQLLDAVNTLGSNLTKNNDSILESMAAAKDSLMNQSESVRSSIQALQRVAHDIQGTHVQFSTDMKAFSEALLVQLGELTEGAVRQNDTVCSRLDMLKQGVDKVMTTSQIGMETISGAMERIITTAQAAVTGLGQMDTMIAQLNSLNDLVKGEIGGLKTETLNILSVIAGKVDGIEGSFGETLKPGIEMIAALKTDVKEAIVHLGADIQMVGEILKSEVGTLRSDQAASLGNVQGTIMQLHALFKTSSESLEGMTGMIKSLNDNYLESLGKIAGLAEGMRKGVDKVGEGMQLSVRDLVQEMKREIGNLEKQYEKTFGNIADLAGKFEGLNTRLKEMTLEIEKEFKDSFERQANLSEHTKTILEHIKTYFEKQEERYKDEHLTRKKKEAIDHFDRATLYFYRGNYELAINEIDKALEIERTAEYLNLKGVLLTELGRFDDSKRVFMDALKLESNLAEIHNNLGLLYLKMKKLDDAVVSFQEAVKKNVNYARAYVNLGKAFIESEKYDDAIKSFEKALEIDPANVAAREAIDLYKKGKIGAE
jgi:tetratricopeptide (TPR) repeat protein